MEEFSDYSSEIVEFQSTWKDDKLAESITASTSTDPIAESKNQSSQTNKQINIETQTDFTTNSENPLVNDKELAVWLKKIYPLVEFELEQGVTPIYHTNLETTDENLQIVPYQKIFFDSIDSQNATTQGLAIWLSVKTNNAPILVLTSIPVHDDWCNHINPIIKIYIPKRVKSQDFIAFSELKTINVNACIKSLSTNQFNKDIFAGGTVSGDLYIWKYATDNNNIGDVNELFCEIIEYGCVIAIDWLSEFQLLSCHDNGVILLWKIGNNLTKDKMFKITKNDLNYRLTTILTLTNEVFLVGTAEGNVFYCSNNNLKKFDNNFIDPIESELEKHKFSITRLQKTKLNGSDVIVSCDLSGEIYFYDIKCSEDEPSLIVKMPLPFKNSIAFTKNGNFILSPGIDGSLEMFRINNGKNSSVQGYENGKGNCIQRSDNGLSQIHLKILQIRILFLKLYL